VNRTRWIVVGTDFSPSADRALECALGLAGSSGANLACVHAFEDALVPHCLAEDRTPALRGELADALSRVCASSGDVHVELILRRGPPWDKLQNVADDLGADLIVVGAHGQRGARIFLGSVTSRLVASSGRCVLVVPGSCRTFFAL